MSRSLRSLLVFVLSFVLIYAPVLALPANTKLVRSAANVTTSTPRALPLIQSPHKSNEVLIKFHNNAPVTAKQQIREVWAQERQALPGTSEVERLQLKDGISVPQALADLQQANRVVEWVEPNYLVTVKALSKGAKGRGNEREATKARQRKATTGTATGLVAVIDTGIAASHPTLRTRLAGGWNVVADTADVRDDNGHGTQMAGIIARVHPQARLLPFKALDAEGIGSIEAVVMAMDRAVAERAQVILYSFGTNSKSQALREAIQRAEQAGVVVITAAGNDGQDLAHAPQYPAAFEAPNLVTVAAVTPQRELADFSNYGQAAHLAAPGVAIRTTTPMQGFTRINGTSAAAAYVAGVASQLKAIRPWVSAATVKQNLLASAKQPTALQGKVRAGIVNLQAALKEQQTPTLQANQPAEKEPINKQLEARKQKFKERKQQKELPDPEMPQTPQHNLSSTRNARPALPAGRVKINALRARQGANYDDPVPTSTANFASYFTELTKPANDTGFAGSKPMQQVDPTMGVSAVGGFSMNLLSRNLNFTAPVLSLPGRGGLNVSLGLSYNSNVWTKNPATNTMFYNAERGFPAPGWRLGFGAIQGLNNSGNIGPYTNSITGKASFLYIQPDGTKRDLAYNNATGKYESYDSSYLDFDAATKILRTAGGTQVTFGVSATASGDYQLLPTEIKDRNGNFITIVYKQLSNNDTVLDYVVDTLGRRIDFYYQNNRLTEIRQDRNGTLYKYAVIDYTAVTLSTQFNSGNAPALDVSGTTVYVPSRITYPTGVNLRFYYTSYGQVHLVEKWVPTISGQGTERPIAATRLLLPSVNSVSYPAMSLAMLGGYWYTDSSPTMTTRYELAENWGTVTTLPTSSGGSNFSYSYASSDALCSNCAIATITAPGGAGQSYPTVHTLRNTTDLKQINTVSGTGYNIDGNPIPVTFKNSTTQFVSDSSSYAANLRPTLFTITDQTNHTRKIALTYQQQNGMWLVQNKDEYNADGYTIYRRTALTYTAYPSQHLLGLPLTTSVYANSYFFTLVAKTENVYDETTTWQDSNNQTVNYWLNAGATVQHDDTNYGSGFTARGNVTSVKQYGINYGSATTSRIITRTSYDTNGNVRSGADAAGNRKTVDLTDNFTNKPVGLGALQAYPYLTADPVGMKAGAQYEYHTGQVVKTFAQRPNLTTEEQVTTMTYDFADRPLRTTNPMGGYVELGYWDNLLRQTTYTKRDVVGGVDQLVYSWQDFDGAGQVLRKGADHPNSIAGKYSGQKFKYDALGQGSERSNVLAVTSSFAIDTSEPGQYSYTPWKWTKAEFDGLGRTSTVEKPDNTYIFTDYSVCGCAGGLVTDAYDERNNKKVTENDFLGRLKFAREYEPDIQFDQVWGYYYIAGYILAAEVEYQYDALDRLTQILHRGTGPGEQVRSFTYDQWGQTKSETTPEAGTVQYTYNANGQLATTTNANYKVTTVSYNTRNLVTGISYNDSTPAVSYGYDDYGARTAMTDGEGAMSYSYNANRQLTSETRTFTGLGSNQYTYNYSYNLGGQLTQAQYVAPSFSKNVNYAYNGTGALSGIGTNLLGSDPATTTNVISGMTYRAFGAASTITYGNNRKATLTYDLSLMRLTQLQVARPNGTELLLYNQYSYTANGLLSGISNGVDWAYSLVGATYNGRNQLVKYQEASTGQWKNYGIDSWGNLTSEPGPNGSTKVYSYQLQPDNWVPVTNRLSSVANNYGYYSDPPVNFSYDGAGNMVQAGSTTYQWDAANRLKSVNSGALGSYGYDGNSKRVKKTESGVTTYYVVSSVVGSAMEVTAAGVQRAYVMNGSSVVAQLNANGQFYWLHLDHLGSGRKMTDTSGNLAYRAEFDPYGKLLYEWSSPTNLNTRKFTGYERDGATGLDYAQARMYGSEWGRFLSADKLGLTGARLTNPKSLNRYSYASGDPINRVDRNGMEDIPHVVPQTPGGFTVTINGGGSNPATTAIMTGASSIFSNEQFIIEEGPIDGGYLGEVTITDVIDSAADFQNHAAEFYKLNKHCADLINAAAAKLGLGTIEQAIQSTNFVDVTLHIAAGRLDSGTATGNAPSGITLGEKLQAGGTQVTGGVTYATTDWRTFSAVFSRPTVYFGGAYNSLHDKGDVRQSRTPAHEMLHALFRKGHLELLTTLSIKTAGPQDEITATREINDWLDRGCQ